MDPTLVTAYRRADEYRQERANEQAWLQGFYFYAAISAVSPILHAFAKEGTRAKPYLAEPLEIRKPRQRNAQPNVREMQKLENGKTVMRAFMTDINKKFEKKGVGESAERGHSGTQNPG